MYIPRDVPYLIYDWGQILCSGKCTGTIRLSFAMQVCRSDATADIGLIAGQQIHYDRRNLRVPAAAESAQSNEIRADGSGTTVAVNVELMPS